MEIASFKTLIMSATLDHHFCQPIFSLLSVLLYYCHRIEVL